MPRKAANAKQHKKFLLKGWGQRVREHLEPASQNSKGAGRLPYSGKGKSSTPNSSRKAKAGTERGLASLGKNEWGRQKFESLDALSSFGWTFSSSISILLITWFIQDAVAFPEGECLRCANTAPVGRSGRNRDVLPLPLDETSRLVIESVTAMEVVPFPQKKAHVSRSIQRKQMALGTQAWKLCQTLTLNMAWGKEAAFFRKPSQSQLQVSLRLAEKSERIVSATDERGAAIRSKVGDWGEKIRSISVGYSGELVEKAQWLTLDQILPGLPPEGKSACVELVDLCSGQVRKCLEDPFLVLKPLEHDMVLPKARVLCADSEWLKIGKELVRRGLARPLQRHQVYPVGGRPWSSQKNFLLLVNQCFASSWICDPPTSFSFLLWGISAPSVGRVNG